MKIRKIPLRTAIACEIVVITTIAAFFLPGGDDLYRFYLPLAKGCLECALNPWHTRWIVFPLRFVPPRLLWPVWVLVTTSGLVWASHRLRSNPVVVLLAFPTLGLIWLGQIDVLIVLGLVLALLSPSPYLRGVGLVLASTKPQVTGIAILVLLWQDHQRWRTLLIPALVFLASLLVWGPTWPLRWLAARPDLGMPVWGLATLFPLGLVTLLAIFLVKGKRSKLTAALLASALAVPWFGVYSYVVFLPFITPWWAVPISYLWIVAYPWLGNKAMRFAWVLPSALMVSLLWPAIRKGWPGLITRFEQLLARTRERTSP